VGGLQGAPADIAERKRIEEALPQERDLISAVLDTVEALVLVLDKQGRIVRFNQACERTTGYSLEEVAGKCVWDLFLIPEELEQVKAVFMDLRAGQFPNEYENFWVAREGDRRLITWYNTALLDDGGEVEYVIGTGIDITDRRRAEEALRESEETWRSLTEYSPDHIMLLDRDANILFMNHPLPEPLGEQVIGTSFYDYALEEYKQATQECFERVLRTGQPDRFESVYPDANGNPLVFESYVGPAMRSGEVWGLTVRSTDITKRKEAEKALQRLSDELGERVKELNCLYGISALVEKPGIALAEILQGTVDLVPSAWQYPEITCVRIILDDQEFSTENWRETVWRQTRDVRVHGRRAGRVEVGYLAERPESAQGPFLQEEGDLINAIAERLGRIVERMRAEEALRETTQLLETVLEHTHVLVACMDPQFNFLRVNRAYAEADEREVSFFPGKNHFDLYPHAENEAIFHQVAEAGEPWFAYAKPFEYAEHPERGVSYWDCGLVPTRGPDGTVAALVLSLTDVTARVQAREALKLSEERYTLAQRAANIGSWDWDIQTDDLYWSDQIEPMFGFGRGEFGATYEAFLQCVHPEDRQYVVGSVNACVQGSADYAIEHRIVWPDGTVRWVSETGDVIRDENGRALRMLGVVQDITEHKRAEERIRQQNEFLTSVLESLTHPFYVVDVADYTVQMANTAAHPGSLPEHSTCYALFHGQSRPCTGAAHVCPIEEIKRTRKSVTAEHIHYDADGNRRNVEVRGYPLFDDEGNVVRVIEYCLDVTERRQAEVALRESEARWRSVTENSPDHVILLDTDLNIQFVNYASPGLTVEELIGTPLYTYVSEERQSQIKGSRVVPRTLDGQVIGLALNARDITEHKRAQEALREAKEAAEGARREEQKRRREADRRRRIAEGLAGVLAALNSNQPLGQVLAYIAEQASQLLHTQAVAICRLQGGAETLVIQAAQGLAEDTVSGVDTLPGVEVLGQAVASRQAVAVPDLATGPTHLTPDAQQPLPDVLNAELFRALLAVPITVQDEVYGGIVLYYAHPRSFSDDELELAAVLSNQIALAIENTRLREQVQQAAATAERGRLARDLHDSVTQALFSASLVAEILPRVWQRDSEEAQHGLAELRHLTRGALAEMRTLLRELRPTALVQTKLHDLLPQLTEAVTGRAELLVELKIEPSPTLPPDVHVTFYRIAQEALHNVVKHAEASQLHVSLSALPALSRQPADGWQGRIVLCVSDDGQGFDAGQTRADQLGLGIMRERAEAVGAELTIESQHGQGTQVVLVWENTRS